MTSFGHSVLSQPSEVTNIGRSYTEHQTGAQPHDRSLRGTYRRNGDRLGYLLSIRGVPSCINQGLCALTANGQRILVGAPDGHVFEIGEGAPRQVADLGRDGELISIVVLNSSRIATLHHSYVDGVGRVTVALRPVGAADELVVIQPAMASILVPGVTEPLRLFSVDTVLLVSVFPTAAVDSQSPCGVAIGVTPGDELVTSADSTGNVVVSVLLGYCSPLTAVDRTETLVLAGFLDGHIKLACRSTGSCLWTGNVAGVVSDARFFSLQPPMPEAANRLLWLLNRSHLKKPRDGRTRFTVLDAAGRAWTGEVTPQSDGDAAPHVLVQCVEDVALNPLPGPLPESLVVSNRSFVKTSSLSAGPSANSDLAGPPIGAPDVEALAPEVEPLGATLSEGLLCVAACDVDLDGFNELVFCTAAGSIVVCRDDGCGRFAVDSRCDVPSRVAAAVPLPTDCGLPRLALLGPHHCAWWHPIDTATAVATLKRRVSALEGVVVS